MTFRILALSGGGIRGIFQATYLKEFFRLQEGDATTHFNMIAGTSTGAIVGGCAAYTIDMSVVIELFRNKGPEIFAKRLAAGIRRGPRYASDPIRKTLNDHLGGQRLADAKVPLILPSALLNQYGHHLFSSKDSPKELATDAILCSSAAPTYFAPVQPTGQQRSFVDGGVWANNPALAAVMHAIDRHGAQPSEIKLVILGNGFFPAGTKHEDFLRVRPLSKNGIGTFFDLMFAAQETAAAHYAKKLLSEKQVFVLNTPLSKQIFLDDVEESIATLPALAEQLAEQTHEELRKFLEPTPPVAAKPEELLQAPEVPNELAIAAAEITSRLHSEITSNPWIQTEEEHVSLTTPSETDRAILQNNTKDIYRCDIVTKRRGSVCRRESTIGFRLEGFTLNDSLDFEYILGRGLLNDQAYQQLRDGIKIEHLDQYIGVQDVMFRNQAETVRYVDLELRHGPGYFVFAFRCPKDFAAFDTYTELELRIRTYLSRDHAWYTYLTTNTITKSLTTSFQAPFRVTGKQHLGRNPKEIENQRLAETYYSAFTVNGPVPAGSTVDWIFGTED